MGWGVCICLRVYLGMGWRGVGGVKFCVIDNVSHSMREFPSIIALSLEYHPACGWGEVLCDR